MELILNGNSFLVPNSTPLHHLFCTLPCFLVTQGCLLIVIAHGGNTFSLVAKQKFFNPYWHDVFGEMGSILTCNSASFTNEGPNSCKHLHTHIWTQSECHTWHTHTHTHSWQLLFWTLNAHLHLAIPYNRDRESFSWGGWSLPMC